MSIYLVQHGLSLPKTQDPEQGISEQGRAETQKIAEVAKFYQIQVSQIIHSGKKRAEQTAQIFRDNLEIDDEILAMPGLKPMDDPVAFAQNIDPRSNIMFVGHLPFMQRLVSCLTTDNPEMKVYQFQNSGIVCMDCENDDWFIKWTLNPNIN